MIRNLKIQVVEVHGKDMVDVFAKAISSIAGDSDCMAALRVHLDFLPPESQVELVKKVAEAQKTLTPIGPIAREVYGLKTILKCDCSYCCALSVAGLLLQGRAKDFQDALEQMKLAHGIKQQNDEPQSFGA